MIKLDSDECSRLPSPTFVFAESDTLTLEWCYGGGPGTDHWSVHVYWGADGIEGSRTYGRVIDGRYTVMGDETRDWQTVVKWLAEEPGGLYPAELELQRELRRK